MKRIMLIFGVLASMHGLAYGQNCPNGSFENWNIYPFGVPDSGWYNSNPESVSVADSFTVWSVTGVSGHAVHIQTAIIGTDTLQAYIINTTGDPKSGSGGVPYSQQPTAITGYYRYGLAGNDSALIMVIFKKAGSIVSADEFKIRGTGSLSAFTPFSFPLSLTVVPDSVIIAAASSNLEGAGLQSGSWLELDELAFTGTGITQPIQGGTFDNWTTNEIDVPIGWQQNIGGNYGGNVVRSATHYAGDYSLQLTTMPGGGGGSYVNSGYVTTGQMTNCCGPIGGLPYTLTNDTLTGLYMYAPSGADTGFIYVNMTAAGLNVGGSTHMFYAASTWTPFSIPLSAVTTPDSMRIDIQSGKWQATVAGSILKIDYLQLKSQPLPPVRVKDVTSGVGELKVYPNPATDLVHFVVSGSNITCSSVELFDLAGRKVLTQRSGPEAGAVDVSTLNLSQGVYLYKVDADGCVFRGVFIKE